MPKKRIVRYITAGNWFSASLSIIILQLLACGHSPPDRETWTRAVSGRNLGLAYMYRADYDRAAQEFEALATMIPADPLGHANLAAAHLKRQNTAAARVAIDNALGLDSGHPIVRAIEADVLEAEENSEKALSTLLSIVRDHPDEFVMRYKYLKLLQRVRRATLDTDEALEQLVSLLVSSPDNLALLSELGETQVQAALYDDARSTYGAIRRLLFQPDEKLATYLEETLRALADGDAGRSRKNSGIVGNLLKVDPGYRSARDALGDPTQQHPPMNVFITAPADLDQMEADQMIDLKFIDVSANALRDSVTEPDAIQTVKLVDYDGDGRLDVLRIEGTQVRLFQNVEGSFLDRTESAGLSGITAVRLIAFGDIDNDGDQDMYVNRDGRDRLYSNDQGKFSNMLAVPFENEGKSGPIDAGFGDLDHDGDLDLMVYEGSEFRVFRNAGSGEYTDVTRRSGIVPSVISDDRFRELIGTANPREPANVADWITHLQNVPTGESLDVGTATRLNFGSRFLIADFDLDGAMDLFLTVPDGPNIMYRNVRQGQFLDWSARFGLSTVPGAQMALPGDFNNDGALDILLLGGNTVMLENKNGSRLEESPLSGDISRLFSDVIVTDAESVDFDNDGFHDIVASGIEATGTQSLRLIRNLGGGKFVDAGGLLPGRPSGFSVATGDLDRDGDMDLVHSGSSVQVLDNEGGNRNHWFDIQLAASLRGSGKNNFHGIGALVEVKTATHYQSVLVTDPVTHIGIGSRDHADVVRIIWPNGVPHNKVLPETSTLIVENQRLKGSCPSLYTWNGERYVFVTHLMTRSAIGALSETGAPTHPDAAADFVKIRGDQMTPRDGKFTINVVEELWDAVYMDTARLTVVDHPVESDVYVNEIYVPPPYPDFQLLTATDTRLPLAATDQHGHDILPHLANRDSLYAGDYEKGRYQGQAETHSITLDLGRLNLKDRVRLYLCGWIMPAEPSANLALSQQGGSGAIVPYLEVPDARGSWQTVIGYTGFPSGEHKTIMVDLDDKFLATDFRVRITTNLEIYWSEAFFTVNEPDIVPSRLTHLMPQSADLHYRGYSREYRVTANGPFLRDYSQVSTTPQWLPFEGYRTRYGDVTELYQAADNRYAVFSSGEEVTLTFDASDLPDLPAGWTRDYILHTDGWLKEGDLNTDTAATVSPMPFHGMREYPHGSAETFPVSAEIQEYQEEFNTRWVSQNGYRERFRHVGDGMAAIDR